MIENLLYVIVGFAVTYLSLELAWHFAACRLKENVKVKPCVYKELKTVLMMAIATTATTTRPQTRGGRIY